MRIVRIILTTLLHTTKRNIYFKPLSTLESINPVLIKLTIVSINWGCVTRHILNIPRSFQWVLPDQSTLPTFDLSLSFLPYPGPGTRHGHSYKRTNYKMLHTLTPISDVVCLSPSQVVEVTRHVLGGGRYCFAQQVSIFNLVEQWVTSESTGYFHKPYSDYQYSVVTSFRSS